MDLVLIPGYIPVEINVARQADNITSLPAVRNSIKKRGFPDVHGWIYDISTGELEDVEEILTDE